MLRAPFGLKHHIFCLTWIDGAQVSKRKLGTLFCLDQILFLDLQLKNLGIKDIVLQLYLLRRIVEIIFKLDAVLVDILDEIMGPQVPLFVFYNTDRVVDHQLRLLVEKLFSVFLQS